MGVTLYCGVNEVAWNELDPSPGSHCCVSPVMGRMAGGVRENRVRVPKSSAVLQDSGAFSDSPEDRLPLRDAMLRQKVHGEKYGYSESISVIGTYDLLIDEKWIDGTRKKIRWGEDEAWMAVEETVRAAEFYHHNRGDVGLVLNCQGVTTNQYMQCVDRVVELYREGDVIGLGGWCILGKQRKRMLGPFRETIIKVVPFLANHGVKKVHIWGVIFPTGLGELLWMCNAHSIALSTDSAGPQFRPVMGEWGYGDWRDKTYRRKDTHERGRDRKKHVELTRRWLSDLESTQYYRDPRNKG